MRPAVEAVGQAIGLAVGLAVGLVVGLALGLAVGLVVGLAVGLAVVGILAYWSGCWPAETQTTSFNKHQFLFIGKCVMQ